MNDIQFLVYPLPENNPNRIITSITHNFKR
jgi:hypothetical protein